MTDVATSGHMQDDSSPLEPARLADLFLRPKRFFALTHDLDRRPELYLVIWLAGMANVQDRFDLRLTGSAARQGSGGDDLFVTLASSWPSTWITILAVGALAGALAWLIGGWWYGVRLNLSGAPKGHEREGRLTWAYVALVTSLPTFVLLLVSTVRYESYLDAFRAPADPLTFLALGLIFWSVVVSYQGATARFKLTPAKARFWFLILPLLFHTVVLFIFGIGAALVAHGVAPDTA